MNEEDLEKTKHYYEMQIIEGERWIIYCKEKLAKVELDNCNELELELEFND
jgi:hypothetical protein|tara:strand:- start:20 stop:172 length:153 start_codon:yes stop_codon:yes gene_type:complete